MCSSAEAGQRMMKNKSRRQFSARVVFHQSLAGKGMMHRVKFAARFKLYHCFMSRFVTFYPQSRLINSKWLKYSLLVAFFNRTMHVFWSSILNKYWIFVAVNGIINLLLPLILSWPSSILKENKFLMLKIYFVLRRQHNRQREDIFK